MKYEQEEYEQDDYEQEEPEQEEEEEPRDNAVLPLAGGTLLTAELLSLIVRGGWLGAGAGLLGSLFVYFKGQEIIDVGKDLFLPAYEQLNLPRHPKQAQTGNQRKLMDRLMGRFPDEPHEDEQEEERPRRRKQSKLIVLSPELVLDRADIIGKSIFIVGQRRSGKTTLGALLAEQMGAHNIPMFIPDSEGDLLSLYDVLPRGVIAAAPGSRWEDDEEVNLWTVTTEDADVLGFQILYEGMQVIFDMSSFANDDEAWQVVIGVIDGLFSFAQEYPEQRCPVEVFLDEAQKYLPQNLSTSAIQDTEVRDGLLDAYRNVSGTGGKRGITPVILSQRFAETNNEIIAQSEIRFILRQTQDNDLERCKKYVRANTATTQEIASFRKGQGVFVGEDGTQLLTVFNQRQSDGRRSGTPGVEAVDRFAHRPLRLQKPERTIIRQDQDIEDEQRQAPPQPRQKVDTLVARGADAWQAGEQSIDKLAYALGLNFNQARQLKPKVLAEVKRREMAETSADEQA